MNNPNNPGSEAGPARAYVLGHSAQELERLNAQECLVGPITRQFLRDAGRVPGMRVLDVGSGAGDVALLAADLVGNGGEVTGAESAPAAVSAARARAEARSLRHVSFRACDPTMIRKLAGHLRPGGVMVFHEVDWDGTRSFPPSPTYERCNRWIVETFRLLGTETRMAAMLHAAFVAAGLPAPAMRLNALIGGGAGSADWLHMIAELARTLLPAMERLGVATAAEVGIETLADRLRREVADGGGVIVGRSEIGAWSHV